jgi:peptidoglycan hydrolase-like protein with peptidoglycan-binding domain
MKYFSSFVLLFIICLSILSCSNKDKKYSLQNEKVVTIEQSEPENFIPVIELKTPHMNNQNIFNLQNLLLSLGFFEIGEADGYYGPLTADVIKSIQKFLGFEQNGIVENELWKFLFDENNNVILKNINIVSRYNINELQKETESRMGYSTEGGEIEKYSLGNEIKHIRLHLAGETFQLHYYLYYISSSYYFIIQEYYRYPFPIYYLWLDPNELSAVELERNAYELEVIANDEFWLKTAIEYDTYIKNNSNLYQIKNGFLSKTDFDLNRLIELIEGKS